MRKSPWFALSLLLCTGPIQAQSQPAASPKATAAPKPIATPAQPATAASAPAGAAETHPAPAPAKDKPAPAANADKNVEWTLDASHSQIGFVARHLGFSKTNGHFNKYNAVVRADPKSAKLANLEATVDAASIDTGIEKRDKHLRSEDFLNTDKFPQLKLVSKSFKWNGNKFTAVVDLTIRDVTKPVTFKGELLGVHKVNFGQGEQLRAGYEASATINRKDFGLTWNMVTEGLSVVADPVQLDLAAELSYAPVAPAPTAGAPTTPAQPAQPAAVKAAAAPTAGGVLAPQASAAAAATKPSVPTMTGGPVAPSAPKLPQGPQAPAVKPPTTPAAPTVKTPSAAPTASAAAPAAVAK